MTEDKFIKLINYLKKKEDLRIYDTHIHPLDVMGISHSNEDNNRNIETLITNPSLVDKLSYNKIANLLLRGAKKFSPNFIGNAIKKIYKSVSGKRLLYEMNEALVDIGVIIPLAPWVTVEQMAKSFSGPRFIFLGSIDIHSIDIEDIEYEINKQIILYQIKGIKLHPNLQGFFPQPSKNLKDIKFKLEKLYKIVSQKKLYLLFHGGYTNFFTPRQPYQNSTNALLKNFINDDGTSEILGVYDTTIVIAHLGNYAKMKRDFYYLKLIADRYSNIYFDTAGINSSIIKWFLEKYGSKRLLFGSDAFYHNMKCSLINCISAIKNTDFRKDDLESSVCNVLGRNYEKLIS